MAHDAFEMAAPAAAAEVLLVVERDDRVAALPHAFGERVAAEADAVAERPHAKDRVELAGACGEAGRERVGIVDDR